MEFVTSIICPGLNKSRFSLVDLNDISTDLSYDFNKIAVKITRLGRCENLLPENKCNLTDNECIFRELPEIERIDFEAEDFFDQSYF